MKHFLLENNEWLIGIVTTIMAWFGGRKLKNSNEKNAELQNLLTIREMEKQLVEDARQNSEELREIIKEMQDIIDNKDNVINEQKALLLKQRIELEKYKKKYGELV